MSARLSLVLGFLVFAGPFHAERAAADQGSSDPRRAIEAYTAALRENPANAHACYNRALAYHELGDLDQVIADDTKAVEIDKGFAEAFLNRGNAYAQRMDFVLAEKDYARALEFRREYALAYYNRSLVRYRWAAELKKKTEALGRDAPANVAEVNALDRKAAELSHDAQADLDRAKKIGLPPRIAKRLERAAQVNDVVSAAQEGYVRVWAEGARSLFGVRMRVENLTPVTLPLTLTRGTRFVSAGDFQNMVATQDMKAFDLSPMDTSELAFPPAACLNAGRPIPFPTDRFSGVTRVVEDGEVAKFLAFAEAYRPGASEQAFAEYLADLKDKQEESEIEISIKEAQIQTQIENTQSEPQKEKLTRQKKKLANEHVLLQAYTQQAIKDFPGRWTRNYQVILQSGVWAITDGLPIEEQKKRSPSILDIHGQGAATILDLAGIVTSLGVVGADPATTTKVKPEEIAAIADGLQAAASKNRKVASLANGIDVSVAHFRQWTPGEPRWEGAYFVGDYERCVPWLLDKRLPLTFDLLGGELAEGQTVRQLGEGRTVSTTLPEQGLGRGPAAWAGSSFRWTVVPQPKPIGQFVEVAVLFRNRGRGPAEVQVCSPADTYLDAQLQLGNGAAMAPLDFLPPLGLVVPPAVKTNLLNRGLAIMSEVYLSPTGCLAFELGKKEQTCAVYLFDVPRDADQFRLVIQGRAIELGMPLSPSAFDYVDDKVMP